ncbi:hypothetical protein FG05_30560 [Fusarium graminearum]|nr:hypothetical protein FG05_30560 [Fusarium graminearum]
MQIKQPNDDDGSGQGPNYEERCIFWNKRRGLHGSSLRPELRAHHYHVSQSFLSVSVSASASPSPLVRCDPEKKDRNQTL